MRLIPRPRTLLILSQHGRPLQIVDMGETAIDEETFNEYLEEMRQHYTADKVGSCVWYM